MRKYICDNCGKETDVLWLLRFEQISPKNFGNIVVIGGLNEIGEYCSDCGKKIEARIKEGVQ